MSRTLAMLPGGMRGSGASQAKENRRDEEDLADEEDFLTSDETDE